MGQTEYDQDRGRRWRHVCGITARSFAPGPGSRTPSLPGGDLRRRSHPRKLLKTSPREASVRRTNVARVRAPCAMGRMVWMSVVTFQIAIIIALILLNGFFAMSET